MDGKNHHEHGQLKRKPADFTHIFSVSAIDAVLLLPNAFSCQDMMTYIGLTLERICGVWVFNKKNTQHSII